MSYSMIPSIPPTKIVSISATHQKSEFNLTDERIEKVKDILSKDTQTATVSPLTLKKVSANYDARASILKEKDSHFWICVSRKEGPHGGFIYGFKFRKEFEDPAVAAAKNDEVYPAIEATFEEIKPHMEKDPEAQPGASFASFLNDLGFSIEETEEGSLFYVPDQEALSNSWEQAKARRLEQSETVIEKLKKFQQQTDFVEWERGFISELKKMYLRYQNDSEYEYEPDARKLIQRQWGNQWGKENSDQYMKMITQFCKDNLHNDKLVNDDRVWTKWNSQRDKFLFDMSLAKLIKEYPWLAPNEIRLNQDKGLSIDSLKERMQLPKLLLDSSEGIETDRDFVKSYLKFDALISKKIMHDVPIHLIPVLLLKWSMLSAKEKDLVDDLKKETSVFLYKLESARNGNAIDPKTFEKLMLTLGVFVDTLSTSIKSFPKDSLIEYVWQDTRFQKNPNLKIWQERYPHEPLEADELTKGLKTVIQQTG